MPAEDPRRLVAHYVMASLPRQPSRSEGAGTCVARLLATYRATLRQIMDGYEENKMKTSIGMEAQIEAERIDAAIRHGYKICHAHYPPAVMVSKDDNNWTCPECDNQKTKGGLTVGTLSVPR